MSRNISNFFNFYFVLKTWSSGPGRRLRHSSKATTAESDSITLGGKGILVIIGLELNERPRGGFHSASLHYYRKMIRKIINGSIIDSA